MMIIYIILEYIRNKLLYEKAPEQEYYFNIAQTELILKKI